MVKLMPPSKYMFIHVSTLLLSLAIHVAYVGGEGGGVAAAEKKSVPLFIFGDSSVDVGNNNFIKTIPENQANYKPYGQNGFFQKSTGRFSDGRVIVDYLAEYANLPLIPPYLEPLAEYENGVNFASGGAGILSTTNPGLAIDLKTQLRQFEEVRKSLGEKFGDANRNKLISEGVYFISMGSNDYMGGYLDNPTMQQLHPPEEYVGMVIGNLTQAIQELYEKGGRKFGFLSLCPLGCLPALRALNLEAKSEEGCFEEASALALAHNNALKALLTILQQLLKDFKYCNSNFYNWLLDRINNPSKYGFKEGVSACCGIGPYGGIFTCGGTKNITDFNLCDNPDEHLWWDSFHPSDKVHQQFAKALWDGPPVAVGPYNLEDLFTTRIGDIVDDPRNGIEGIVF